MGVSDNPPNADCPVGDSKSVTDFGRLPSSWVGLNCNKESGFSIYESDVKLNSFTDHWVRP
jgi:hypothetical protein